MRTLICALTALLVGCGPLPVRESVYKVGDQVLKAGINKFERPVPVGFLIAPCVWIDVSPMFPYGGAKCPMPTVVPYTSSSTVVVYGGPGYGGLSLGQGYMPAIPDYRAQAWLRNPGIDPGVRAPVPYDWTYPGLRPNW